MFNSALEVAKFENVQIKTVSGIRGQIKKAVRENFKVGDNHSKFDAGTFRASFEDKILMSDIIFCRMWVPVAIPQFYNPVLSLLDDYISKPKAIEGGNPAPKLLMRTTAEIRREEKIAQEVNKDSLYTPIVRVPREFRKLHLPSKLQASLPFASKPKQEKPLNRQSYAARRAVVLEPEERKSRAALQMLSTLKASKTAIRLQSNNTRLKLKQKKREQEQAKFTDVHKEEKKRKYRADGITMERKAKATESTPDQRPHKKRKTKK